MELITIVVAIIVAAGAVIFNSIRQSDRANDHFIKFENRFSEIDSTLIKLDSRFTYNIKTMNDNIGYVVKNMEKMTFSITKLTELTKAIKDLHNK